VDDANGGSNGSGGAAGGGAVNNNDSGVLVQANVMRLLSLLFDYGHLPEVR
jgi:hypothetical protein